MATTVCVMTSVHPPFDVRIYHKECLTLARQGYRVVLVAPHDRDEIIGGVTLRAVRKPARRLQRFLSLGWAVYRQAAREDADIYHVHDPELLPWAQLLRLRGKCVIFDMHENTPKSLLTKSWIRPEMRKFLSWIYRPVERLLMTGLPVIFAEDSYAADYRWVRQSEVIHNYPIVEDLLAIRERKHDRATVGYMGSVSRERGSIVTLRALKQLEQEGYSVDWECIGPISPAHQAELEEQLAGSALRNVRLVGALPALEGWKRMARCHVGLAVLEPLPNYVGSYPTKMFEYMAMALPAVVSDVPLYREVVEENGCGICVDPQSSEQVANAIRWLLDNPQEAAAMGMRGRAAVQARYNWDSEAARLCRFYSEISRRSADCRRK